MKSKKHHKRGVFFRFFFFVAVCFSFINSTAAQGDLLIFPKRIVFDGKKKVEQIILSNIGKDSAVYSISFIEYKMTEQGEFQIISEPEAGQRFATPYLRVFPRRVTLAASESQTVKVQIINFNTLDDGEYRSHLYFRAEQNNKPLGQETKKVDSTAIRVQLRAVYGISIATIINKGISSTVTSISGLNYTTENNSGYFLDFTINRSGNMSTYGDINIQYISKDSKAHDVGKVTGLAVYAPGSSRKVKMQLKKPDGVSFEGGKFKIVYRKNGSKEVIAEAEQRF